MDLDALRVAVDEARVLQTWLGGAQPPASALENVVLRRRLLTRALETRVVRLELARRGLGLPQDELRGLLRAAALGKPPVPFSGSPPGPLDGPAPEDLEARLFARFGAPVARVEQVARDLVGARVLTEALLDDRDDATLRALWVAEQTTLKLDLVGIPRVPASKEIDRATRTRSAEIEAWYEKHRTRFVRPERALVARVFVGFGDDQAQSRKRLDALRDRVVGGEPVAAVATEGSEGPNARRGGRLGGLSRTQLPAAFEVAEKGGITPVLEERQGWAFYVTEGRLPAWSRTLDDARVQREIAATLLRAADQLPHARKVAERARALLRHAPDGDGLKKLEKAERLRRRATKPFHQGGARLVPTVGLAPKLFAAVFELDAEHPVSRVFHVRQSYLVARLVERVDADVATWPAARAEWVRAWRARTRSTIVQTWLSTRLEGQKMWVDMARLRTLSLADLGLPPQ